MDYYIYRHRRLKDGSIFYIGKGRGDRFSSERGRNTYWTRIVKKDGGFIAEIVKDTMSETEAFELEVQLIKEIGLDKLTNITEGGVGGNTYTDETKKRISEMMSNRVVSEETKYKQSKSATGKTGYWKDKKRPEHSSKIKQAAKDGVYTNNGKSIRTDVWRDAQSKSASKRIRKVVVCDKCGIEILDTHLAVHQRGKNCK